MRVVPVLNQSDNYAYLVIDDKTNQAAAVDAYDVPKVQSAAEREGVTIAASITTHHHHDHSGGNKDLKAAYPDIPFYGGSEKPFGITKVLKHEDEVGLGERIKIRTYATPCHTKDSLAWFLEDKAQEQRGVLTGDTLFTAGCGRFFEGDAHMMNHALNEVLASLPKDTIVWNGHEYTKSNVAFAASVEPENADVQRLRDYANSHASTVGKFTIGDELKHNPFMRLKSPAIQKATGETNEVKVMAKLREMKNSFRG